MFRGPDAKKLFQSLLANFFFFSFFFFFELQWLRLLPPLLAAYRHPLFNQWSNLELQGLS